MFSFYGRKSERESLRLSVTKSVLVQEHKLIDTLLEDDRVKVMGWLTREGYLATKLITEARRRLLIRPKSEAPLCILLRRVIE